MLENKEIRDELMNELKEEYDIEYDTFDVMYVNDKGCSMYINIEPIKEKILHDHKMKIYNEIERETRLCALDELFEIATRKKHVMQSYSRDEGKDSYMTTVYRYEYFTLQSAIRELAENWDLLDEINDRLLKL